ncbi:kinase-like domain-containing protein [Rhizophagus irregularis DAOM 181602=DAOM 197198]|nr:kinase-like domain-containing protein [Rhizophagus irregularis DAOM 181602=DAOM 197198]
MVYAKNDITSEFLREIESHTKIIGYVTRCYVDSNDDDDSEIKKQVEEAERINEKFTPTSLPYNGTTLSYTTNPQAVYTSRLLDFKDLPEPKNAIDNKDDDNSFGEYSESIEAIDFTKLNLDENN